MSSKELEIPTVYQANRIVGYGGNQAWFHRSWHRQAGCASTTAANLAAYYAASDPKLGRLYPGNPAAFILPEFLQLMGEMYRYMRPGFWGYPFVRKFARQFVRYGLDRGCRIRAELVPKRLAWEEAFAVVKKHIDDGNPVALLVLLHRSPGLQRINWHWLTLSGYCEAGGDEPRVILSNCGSRETYAARELFEAHQKNIIRMVCFRMMFDDESEENDGAV